MSRLIRLLIMTGILSACTTGNGGSGAPAPGQFLAGDGLPADNKIDIASVPDAVPVNEVLSETGNRPYNVYGKHYVPLRDSQGYRAEGIASWYGTKFHGRKTSSGEPYNMYAMSAAHRTLPLPSYLRVTNLSNQRTVIVKVNDRGPFVDPGKRIIDLSYVAAAKLGVVATGTARVRLEAVTAKPGQVQRIAPDSKSAHKSATAKRPESVEKSGPDDKQAQGLQTSGNWPDNQGPTLSGPSPSGAGVSYLQMGAFSVRSNAETLLSRISRSGMAAYISYSDGIYKVKSGPYEDSDQALRRKLEIDRKLNIETRVVLER